MNVERLQELIATFKRQRVLVLGDFFLDRTFETDPRLAETSPDSGCVVGQVVKVHRHLAAAGAVVNNLAALGTGHLFAMGAIGEDGEGYELRQALNQLGCNTEGLLQSHETITSSYLRICESIDRNRLREVGRYSARSRQPMPNKVQEKLARHFERLVREIDAVIVMDQISAANCGTVTDAIREFLIQQALAHPRVVFWADSKRRIRQFRHMVIKPNQFEAVGRKNPLPGDELSPATLKVAVQSLRSETQAPVFVTCGEKGTVASDPESALVPTLKLTGPIDPWGAGDSATAGAALALCSGATPREAALVGNLVASVTVTQLGVAGVTTPPQLLAAFDRWKEQYDINLSDLPAL